MVLSIIPFASGNHSGFRDSFDHIISEWINACYFTGGMEELERCFQKLNDTGVEIFSYISPENFEKELFSELVRQFPNLKNLKLFNISNLFEIEACFEDLINLESLDLSQCRNLTGGIGPHLAKLINLKSLDLGSCSNLTDKIGSDLAHLTNLTSLDLGFCSTLTDAIGPYLENLTNLTSLSLSRCPKLTDGIAPYLASLINLQVLNIRDNSKLTNQIHDLLAHLPKLKKIFL